MISWLLTLNSGTKYQTRVSLVAFVLVAKVAKVEGIVYRPYHPCKVAHDA